MRRLRTLLLLLVLAAASIALALGAGEWVARRRFPDLARSALRQSRPESRFLRFDPHYGWLPVAGTRTRFRRVDFDTEVTINADGFRGPSVPVERTPGRPRLLLLGDSFAFGHGVEDDETAARVLARIIPGLEVVNLGVTGFSNDQEYLLLRERGLAWRPDVVVLLLCANDLLDNGRSTAWGLYWKPRFILEGDSLRLERETLPSRVPLRMRLARELNRRFVLYEILKWKWESFHSGASAGGEQVSASATGAGSAAAAGDVGKAHGVGERAEAQVLTRRLLAAMAETTRAHGAEFLLVTIPGFPEPELLRDLPPDGTGARLDLEPIFAEWQAEHPDSSLNLPVDGHWNPRGQEIAAEAIARAMEERDWLEEGP